jgi:hypothetical protein
VSATDDGATRPFRDEYCDSCGTLLPPFGTFCPTCGALRASLRESGFEGPAPLTPRPVTVIPVATRRTPSWRLVIKSVMAFGMLTFVAQLFISLAALIYGTTIVLPVIADGRYTVYVIAPVLMAVGQISGDALAAYYAIIVAAILASATWLFLTSYGDFAKELKMKAKPRKHSAIFDLCGLMFAVLFLNVVVVLISGVLWEEPTSPTENAELWELLFLLANASVWEELIVRVLLIGVPLLIMDFARQSYRSKKHNYLLGGGFNIGVPEVTLILISSALFGFGHYDGWGAWKVFPSAVAGVAFGYMFLRHGLASAIMLHFGFDYLSMPPEVFSDGSDLGVLVLLGVAVLAWMAMGAVFFGYYIIRMVEFATKQTYFDDHPQQPTPYFYYRTYGYPPPQHQWSAPSRADPYAQRSETDPTRNHVEPAQLTPPQAQHPGGFFICPACGFTGARWENGRFQCLRCGAVV